ncbi:transient receptor potential channel pyrexia [Eurytemora carolleeae]|nr:transient receptor potential channel pyrexia [Eurytemora carolleeae]|eukprot:XP_023338164.1 transient receptor potential channel pyrexia-like [Eurytemora affinis]
MVMATGEYEFEGIFMDTQLPFPGATVFMFVIFVLVMAIIMMNLLVGLAVDDIKEVQDHAELKKLSSQVEQIFELEKILPSFILERRSVQKIRLDSKESTFWKLKDVMTKQNIWETITEREQRREEKEGLDDLMKSLDNIKEEISEKMIKLQSEFSTQMKLLREELKTDGN